MQTWSDGLGRRWEIRLTFGARQLIKSRTSQDVLLIDSDLETLERFGADIELIADCAWILCESQATKRDISMESFSEGLTDEAFVSFRDVLMGEIAVFLQCLQPERGERLRVAIEAIKKAGAELMTLQTESAQNLIDLLSSESTSLSDTSTSLQESSA